MPVKENKFKGMSERSVRPKKQTSNQVTPLNQITCFKQLLNITFHLIAQVGNNTHGRIREVAGAISISRPIQAIWD